MVLSQPPKMGAYWNLMGIEWGCIQGLTDPIAKLVYLPNSSGFMAIENQRIDKGTTLCKSSYMYILYSI